MPNRVERPDTRHRAVLLLGPTGSGKTPLGDLLTSRGLWHSTCLHFDFGANLRAIVERNRPDVAISRADIEFLREVLDSGRLLEDEHFPLAERILRSFLARNKATPETVIVLNGLPRHLGQAVDVDSIVDVEAVIYLACAGDVVLERIHTNIGGDRTERDDDDPESIRRKLSLFEERTAPLLDHYRALGAEIEIVQVCSTTTPHDAWHDLAARR
jgi:adenylate kinase family enzyme